MTKDELYRLREAVDGVRQNVIQVRGNCAHLGGVEPFNEVLKEVENILESLVTELEDDAYDAICGG